MNEGVWLCSHFNALPRKEKRNISWPGAPDESHVATTGLQNITILGSLPEISSGAPPFPLHLILKLACEREKKGYSSIHSSRPKTASLLPELGEEMPFTARGTQRFLPLEAGRCKKNENELVFMVPQGALNFSRKKSPIDFNGKSF